MPISLDNTLDKTEYELAGQTSAYHGKVRDVYAIGDKYLVMVATDRISAFDRILSRSIPYKGQVLNQLAAYFLEKTSDIVPNWLLSVPDPNASIGLKAEPLKVELVIRSRLIGHVWREYKAGKRTICGVGLPDGMNEYDAFDAPILTPTTKAQSGHDEDITVDEILARKLVSEQEWDRLTDHMRRLFARGQEMAADRGLILADTKYEFGRLNGSLVLIDEVHTPDSSRYFYAGGYEDYLNGTTKEKPRHLSKEFVREWLMERGFSGQAGQDMPELDAEFTEAVSKRYIELYQEMTGRDFVKAPETDIVKRIEANVNRALKELA